MPITEHYTTMKKSAPSKKGTSRFSLKSIPRDPNEGQGNVQATSEVKAPESVISSAPAPPPPPGPPPPPPLGIGPLPNMSGKRSNEPAYLAHPPLKARSDEAKQLMRAEPRIKISEVDLVERRKRLRRGDLLIKKVNVERNEMFDAFRQYNYMPMVDSRELLRNKMMKAEVISISFDGIEQLTDAFLYSLYHCQLSFTTVNWISLTGCYNITDEGIYWVSKAFPNLKSISLCGCRKVTEKSLYHLLGTLPHLTEIIMYGTNCGTAPVGVTVKSVQTAVPGLKRATHVQQKPELFMAGCPMLCPMLEDTKHVPETQEVPIKHRKMVILTPKGLPWSPLAVLTGDKDVTPKQGLQYKLNWQPKTENGVNFQNSSAEIFNVFQIPQEQGLLELVVSPGCFVILPYHASAESDPDAISRDMIEIVIAIITKRHLVPHNKPIPSSDLKINLPLWCKKVPCDIDMRRHMVPCDIDMRRHMVPCDIDMRRHMEPCDIDMRRHMVPCDIDMRRHMVPCDIDMRRHMVPCDIDMRRHMVPCDIDMRRHMVPCDIDMRRHMVPCDIDMRRHMVPCDIDMRRHMVPCDIDMRRHMVPCDIDMRRHMVPCDIDMRRHMVQCDIDMRRHVVPCDIDMRRHVVPCDIDMRRHMVPCDIDMRRHMVPCDIDMRRHMVPCDIDMRRHMVPCDIDMRRHMVPCDIDMRRHMVPCDIDMRRHMVPCDIDMSRHMVPCDIDMRRHMVPCDIDMRRHMVPCDIDMRRHMVPCDIDMRRHMVPCDIDM
ncbi:hypothetical protein DPMN_151252 [Dreissena polymorpha]|uniref:Uncharacterized protein n=1 Tax=Dreissena polymorpha TaxID=45954 RepID=A0A9D4FG42_DREPO|nr:hypothetical protein DPMN_151252 [Dreissena polymorpha]